MASSVPGADFPAVDYDLYVHDGAVTTVLLLRDSGIRLAGDGIEWRMGGEARRAALADIRTIRLTSEVETARGPMGAATCQITCYGGSAVTVFGGNSLSSDEAERRARYAAFVAELHRRLSADDRARIRFIAGYGGARFYSLLVTAALSILLLGAMAVAMLLGLAPHRMGEMIALSFGAILNLGLFRLLQLNAPHIYDPANPIGSAQAGSVGDTIGRAVGDIGPGMTPVKRFTAGAIGAVVIAIVVLIAASQQRVSLFEPGRASLAFAAVRAQIGDNPLVTYVAVTPDDLLVETPEDSESSARIDWRASRRTLFGWSEWDDVSGPRTRYPMSMSEDLGDQPFKLARDDTAHLDDLTHAAIARAALGPGATVTKMTLIASESSDTPEPVVRWTVDVDGPNGHAELYADRSGNLFPPTPRPAGPPRIIIKVVAENTYGIFPASTGTWIRIINPDQSVRFDDTLKPGASYRVPDIRGIRLLTGKPETLAVTVDGRPARLPQASYAGRLDTVLDPQALLAAAQGQM